MESISGYIITNKVVIIRIALLVIFGIPMIILLAKWIKVYITKKMSAQQGMLFSKLVLYSGLIIIFISVLSDLGFKLAHLLGAAGIVGIAVGFASQTSVSNIISGLFLIAEKPFEVDDVITVGGTTGVILSIDILSVKLRTFDNKFIRIPNETLIKSELTNITRFPIRRVDITVGVAYKENISGVRKILLDIAHKNPLCLNDPKPMVVFSGFGDSSIDLMFLVWAPRTDWLNLKNSIMEEIKQRFDEEGIEIPFPHLSLYTGSATIPLPVKMVE
jgi:small-conductance mechanosensitive channel